MPTTGYSAAIDSNDLLMSYIAEAAWGTTPANPVFQLIRLDSEGFSSSKTRNRPNEIDPSGQATAAITTKVESTGSLGFSVSPGLAQNPLLASSLNGAWTGETVYTGTNNATTSSVSASARTCTLTCTAATFTTAGSEIYVGQTIRVVTPNLDFTAIVGTVAATILTLTDCVGNFATANSGTNVTIYSIGMFYSGSDATISATSGRTCTLTCTAGVFASTGKSSFAVKGQFIKITSAGTSAMNMIARIKTVSSGTVLLLDCCSVAPVDGALSGVTTLRGAMLRNGSTVNTFTFEKKLASDKFLRYTGCMPNDGSLDVGVGDYLKGTMNFINKAETSATSAISGATYAPAPTNTVIDSVKGIGTVWRGADTGTTAGVPAALSAIVQKISIKWTKEGAAGQFGIGSATLAGVRSGKILVTGNMSTYFNDFTLFDQFISEQAGPISFSALDGLASSATAKGYQLTFCNATIMNPKVVAGGPSQDVMAEFEIEGAPDVTGAFGGKTIQIDYFN